jgi:hypothetical protein
LEFPRVACAMILVPGETERGNAGEQPRKG